MTFAMTWIGRGIIALGLVLSMMVGGLQAHEMRPGFLQIIEDTEGLYAVTFKLPKKDGRALDLRPVFAGTLEPIGQPVSRDTAEATITDTTYRATSAGLVGTVVEIEGLAQVPLDVLVQISLVDGTQHSAMLRNATTSYLVPAKPSPWQVAWDYLVIGVEHILSGADHLIFVFALMLLVRDRMQLFKAVTAFTVAHSITLALAVLGVLRLPPQPTEAVIALSIVFLAVEVIRSREGRESVVSLSPWIVTFGFGLVHGLGFAGALSEIGLPDQALPVALLFFNIGVEVGQLLFIAIVLVLWFVLRRVPVPQPAYSWRVMCYAIGGIAAFWTIERISGFI